MDIKRITCSSSIEAEGLRSKLMEAGIESVAYDETNSKVARGVLDKSIDVMVDEGDYERAQAIYQQLLAEKQAFVPWCPECGSENVECLTGTKPHKGRWAMFIASVLFFIPFSGFVNAQKFRCKDCGKEFER